MRNNVSLFQFVQNRIVTFDVVNGARYAYIQIHWQNVNYSYSYYYCYHYNIGSVFYWCDVIRRKRTWHISAWGEHCLFFKLPKILFYCTIYDMLRVKRRTQLCLPTKWTHHFYALSYRELFLAGKHTGAHFTVSPSCVLWQIKDTEQIWIK